MVTAFRAPIHRREGESRQHRPSFLLCDSVITGSASPVPASHLGTSPGPPSLVCQQLVTQYTSLTQIKASHANCFPVTPFSISNAGTERWKVPVPDEYANLKARCGIRCGLLGTLALRSPPSRQRVRSHHLNTTCGRQVGMRLKNRGDLLSQRSLELSQLKCSAYSERDGCGGCSGDCCLL